MWSGSSTPSTELELTVFFSGTHSIWEFWDQCGAVEHGSRQPGADHRLAGRSVPARGWILLEDGRANLGEHSDREWPEDGHIGGSAVTRFEAAGAQMPPTLNNHRDLDDTLNPPGSSHRLAVTAGVIRRR